MVAHLFIKRSLFVILLAIPFLSVAQKKKKPINKVHYYKSKSSSASSSYEEGKGGFGVGYGLDYGGIGTRFMYNPSRYFGIYAGAGFAFSDFGFNGGLIARLQPDKKFVPTLNLMYGFNGALYISGDPTESKLYYGPSVGPGLIIRSDKNDNYWHFQVLVPIRASEYDTDLHGIQGKEIFQPFPGPVTLSVGYNFKID